MRKYIFVGIILPFFIISCSCKNKNETNKHKTIQSIYVLFYAYSFETRIPVNSNEITKRIGKTFKSEDNKILLKEGSVLDTTINDEFVLKEISDEICKLLFIRKSQPVDARISCLIKYKDGSSEKLCIGGYFANDIEYKGVRCLKNNKLLFLIKKSINYYSWMDDNIMRNQIELKDESIHRDSIKGYFGKQY